MRGAAIGTRRARGVGSGTLLKNLLHIGNKVRALAGVGPWGEGAFRDRVTQNSKPGRWTWPYLMASTAQ